MWLGGFKYWSGHALGLRLRLRLHPLYQCRHPASFAAVWSKQWALLTSTIGAYMNPQIALYDG